MSRRKRKFGWNFYHIRGARFIEGKRKGEFIKTVRARKNLPTRTDADQSLGFESESGVHAYFLIQ
jgi:hypothetical protein